MAKYRKKPVVIEAVTVAETLCNAASAWKQLPDWLRDTYEAGDVLFRRDSVEVRTLEGTMTGERGDWLIRGIKGEIYPCKPDSFAASYDLVPEELGNS